jgi:hypothetical protein
VTLPGATLSTPESFAGTSLTNAIAMARKITAQINESKNLRFITFFSIQLTWTHYSTASRRDAKIDTSRIKLAKRDSAVLTLEERDCSALFASGRRHVAGTRGREQGQDKKYGIGNGKWEMGNGKRYRFPFPLPHSKFPPIETPCLTA